MQEFIEQIKDLTSKVKSLKKTVDLESRNGELKSLSGEMNEPDFWQDQLRAKAISQKVSDLNAEIESWQKIEVDMEELLNLAKDDEADQNVNLTQDLKDQYYILEKKFKQLEIATLLNGQYDNLSAVVSIYAGAGGTEAQDWAEMLERMYLRFCEKRNWETNIIDKSAGTEAGVKSVSFEVKGRYVYGYLKAESGVHRLVRLSPFDADHARHTSFAMVEVVPEIDPSAGSGLDIKPEDLKIETNTSTGHGGQSVNTTYSAIRITHIPTGLKVSCQNERSQHQNRELALNYLKGKLAKYNEVQLDEERMRLRGELTEAAWGNQIRSYVLHPYKMVKDHRTNYEEHEPDKVLDGEIDNFIEVYLKSKIV